MNRRPDSGFAGVVVVIAGLGVLAGLGACTPGTDITAAESDVVVTQYDNEFNFGALKEFVMPDSVFHLVPEDADSPDDPNLSRENDELILDLVLQNFIDLGYVRVAVDTTQAPPDFAVLVTATSSQFYSATWGCGGYWGYWGWWGYPPGYGCGGPPAAQYEFSTGTLSVSMLDPANADEDAEIIPEAWEGLLNGVLNDTSSSRTARIEDGINQMFKQSPYLGAEQ